MKPAAHLCSSHPPTDPALVKAPAPHALHGDAGEPSWSVVPAAHSWDSHVPVEAAPAYCPDLHLRHGEAESESWSVNPDGHRAHTMAREREET